MSSEQKVIADLRELNVTLNEVDWQKCGYHLEIVMSETQVRGVARCLLNRGCYLVFVSAVHVDPEIEVIYQFAHFDNVCRIKARVSAGSQCCVPTISDIFHGANWHERETRDFFGVDFEGHPNPTPLILAEEDADLKPLLKEDKKLKTLDAVSWPEEGRGDEKAQEKSN